MVLFITTKQPYIKRISITALKSKLEQNQERQIKQLDQEHQDALELLQMRLEENHQVELDEETKRHEQEILEIEAQLVDERLRLKQVESNLDDEIDQLKMRLTTQINDYKKLETTKSESDQQVVNLKAKIQSQNKSFEIVLAEKQAEINASREIFNAEKDKIVNELEADALRKQQQMLIDFNQAQELLKTKINEITSDRNWVKTFLLLFVSLFSVFHPVLKEKIWKKNTATENHVQRISRKSNIWSSHSMTKNVSLPSLRKI